MGMIKTDTSIEAFRASRKWHADLGKIISDDMFIGYPGFTYWDAYGIIMNKDKWHLILGGGDELSTDLEQLEFNLWQYAHDEIGPAFYIRTPKGALVGLNQEHSVMQFTGDIEGRVKVFGTRAAAQQYIDNYSGAGYGFDAKTADIIECEY